MTMRLLGEPKHLSGGILIGRGNGNLQSSQHGHTVGEGWRKDHGG